MMRGVARAMPGRAYRAWNRLDIEPSPKSRSMGRWPVRNLAAWFDPESNAVLLLVMYNHPNHECDPEYLYGVVRLE